jgi:hypothetical protein
MSIEKIFEGIKNNFSTVEITDRLDNEIINWIEDGWEEEGYSCEFDWYNNMCNNEAEDVIVGELIDYGIEKYNNKLKLSIDEYCELDEKLRAYYDLKG